MQRWSGVGVVVLAIGLLSGARPAGAQTLGPVVYNGGVAPSDAPGGKVSDFSASRQEGEVFTLNETTQFSGVRWWGAFFSGARVNNFTVRIFPVSGEVPGVTPLHSFALGDAVNPTAAGTMVGVLAQFQNEAVVPTTTLGAGSYLMSIVNDTAASPNWNWSIHSSGGIYSRMNDTQSWTPLFGASYAFQLTGAAETPSAVPEPSSALLFLPALGALVLMKRRRSA